MVGITAFGAYIPFNRLDRRKIAEAYGEPVPPGEKAVANYDEDSVTMAVEAARDCLAALQPGSLGGVYLATTTSPYREKLSAATVAAALDTPDTVRTVDFTSSLRAGSAALLAAADAAQSGTDNVLVAVADCRTAAAKGQFEQLFGDAAASFVIGSSNVLAEIEDACTVTGDVLTQWREADDRYVRAWEDRFVVSRGYGPLVTKALAALAGKMRLAPGDVHKLVLYAPSHRYLAGTARSLGFEQSQVQAGLFGEVGLTGAAHAPLMLASALESAQPGQRILFATFGEGADALLFRATANAGRFMPRRGVTGHLQSKKNTMNYLTYLRWKGMLDFEPPRRPDPERPSAPAMWRNTRNNLAFYGSRCNSCGTPQIPAQRVCVHCRAKDEMSGHRFADTPARIATYTIDHLTVSQDPPTVFAVVDFEGGGRLLCEMTDCDPAAVTIGMEVEMTFRRLFKAGGIHNYYWKARPKR
ncbi:MAG TPA: 3-hydroxy-3-methylglutaryl CoA synthase [Desulfotomaculum sp.]|nr:MAG: 3-hydroxy-3-methylglutaryl CoA synthase [Desulfotomaculum sp. BICA1-6]HBX23391.1 3-hydroxy-3-methylglutaryl CoA synthase [Desulfotomaculum sp.]